MSINLVDDDTLETIENFVVLLTTTELNAVRIRPTAATATVVVTEDIRDGIY